MKRLGRTLVFWTYTACAFLLAPKAFAQGSSDWSEYEQTIQGGLDVAKKSAKGAGELFFGLAPLFVIAMAGIGSWWGARKKAQREDKDDKIIPVIIGAVASVIAFGLILMAYIAMEKVGIPARQKAMDFWGVGT